MTFVSLTFLLFMPLCVGLYWLLPGRRSQNALLVAASYAFYGWWDYRFCALLLVSTAVDFAVGIGLERTDKSRRRKLLLALSVITNLGLLGFFKYFNFFAESLEDVADGLGFELSTTTVNVVLPVGISFYTFQTLSYSIDVYRGKLAACTSLLDYAAYVSFFPQLVAGPIERGTHLVPQFAASRRFDVAPAIEGCRLILWGFFKKAAVADNLGLFVDAVYAAPSEASGVTLALATVAFAFQIYCDFSGYSDIAIGCARFFGIDLMRNFAYPYFARSLAEFWRRWHISLSTWFRDYLYIPLGGSRGGRWLTARNLLITFVVSGLWHGAAWNFVVWGAINGVILAVHVLRAAPRGRGVGEIPGSERLLPAPVDLVRMVGTFTVVCFAWVFFRAADWSAAVVAIERMVTFASGESYAAFGGARIIPVFGLVVFLVVVEWLQRNRHDALYMPRLPLAARWAVYTIVLWLTALVLPPKPSPFIYFQF